MFLILFLTGFKRNTTLHSYNYYDPYTFVLECFKDKDIVLIGEPHHIKQHLTFLQNLLPKLHSYGISNLCYEFLPYDRQSEIDSLVNAKKFNYEIASDLVASQYFEWTEKEYIDVLKTVWEINSKSDKKFRIIGLGNSEIWDENRFQKWTEKEWASYVKKEVIDKKSKSLIYCGSHHSITKFQQPYFDNKDNSFGLARKDRLGHYLYSMIGERSMTVWLHHLWPDKNNQLNVLPCNNKIDSLYYSLKKPFAFFTQSIEAGNLTDTTSIYGKGYKNFKLKQVADGYIVLNSICESEFNTYKQLVNKRNIINSLQQAKLYYGWENFTIKQLNDSLRKSYDTQKKELNYFKKQNCH